VFHTPAAIRGVGRRGGLVVELRRPIGAEGESLPRPGVAELHAVADLDARVAEAVVVAVDREHRSGLGSDRGRVGDDVLAELV